MFERKFGLKPQYKVLAECDGLVLWRIKTRTGDYLYSNSPYQPLKYGFQEVLRQNFVVVIWYLQAGSQGPLYRKTDRKMRT
jgi:hypothetical protein